MTKRTRVSRIPQAASLATWVLAMAATAACLPVTDATSATRKPGVSPQIVVPVTAGRTTDPDRTTAGCTIGAFGPRSYVIDYLQPPGDSYYLRVTPATCATCFGAPGVWISGVSIALEFRVPCSLPVEVAVVGMRGDSACAPPDAGRVLAGPWTGTIASGSIGIHDFTIPLGQRVPLLHDEYLRITFTGDGAGCSADGTRPRLVTTASCFPCASWNYYPADSADLCVLLLPGTPVIYASVDSCVSPSLASVPETRAQVERLRTSPNPASRNAGISFALAHAGDVKVEIRDLAGRRVRAVLVGSLASGEHEVRWDGRDDAGRVVPAGTYFAVVRTDSQLAAHRVVFVH